MKFLSPIALEGAIWTLPVPIIFFYSCHCGTSWGQWSWWKFIHDMSIFQCRRHIYLIIKDDVTALSWQNNAMINTSCGRVLVMVESTYVSVKIRFYASSWWRHQMETISDPSQGQRYVALMFYFICARTNGCANNRDAGDLKRHRAHYGVTVMLYSYTTIISAVGCQNIGKWFIAMVDYNFGNSITDKYNDIYQCQEYLIFTEFENQQHCWIKYS